MKHDNFYHRQGVTVADAVKLCKALGLSPARSIVFAADLLIVLKHY